MKPCIRWIIGPVHDLGFHILRYSIRKMRTLYGDRFRYVICYNNLDTRQLNKVRSMNCEHLDQVTFADSLCIPPPTTKGGASWKIYPPRLTDAHEISLDNDVVIHSRSQILEDFLESDSMILVSKASKREYGQFDQFVKPDVLMNTGAMAIPPKLDFANLLNKYIKRSEIDDWDSPFDKQGIVSAVFEDLEAIIIDGIGVSWTDQDSSIGMHFVGANRGKQKPWNEYISQTIHLK